MIDALPLLLGPEGYQISRSVRLRSSASAYFNRTLTTPTDAKKWTWSGWVKRGILGASPNLFWAWSGSGNEDQLMFSTDTLRFYVNGGTTGNIITSAVFRDPSSWYHIIAVYDSANATSNDRMILYVNGVRQALSTNTQPTLNYSNQFNTAVSHSLGRNVPAATYFDGYLTEVNFIDGQALTPSSFGETNPITGVWQPKKYAGTYGTNGFYLNFSDNSAATAAAIGKDYSGNGNNWTPNNISVTAGVTYDSMLDVPTQWADGGNGRGNYATLNPVANPSTLLNANLTTNAGDKFSISTIGMTTGKWYCEVTVTTVGAESSVGISTQPYSGSNPYVGGTSTSWGYYSNNGNKYTNASNAAYGATYTTGDVIGIAFDADNGTLEFFKNNTSQGTAYTGLTSGPYFFAVEGRTTTSANNCSINFGQRPFAYTPPTGFKALNTLNLPTPTILKGNQYFDVALQTGNTTGRTVSGLAFQPDLVWVKNRAGSTNRRWGVIDSVRGVNKTLSTALTDAEVTSQTDLLTAFNSDGFTIGADAGLYGWNGFAESYAHFTWKEGATQGFDIVTYTGNGGTQNISHNLGVAPRMMIVKSRSVAQRWTVYHASVSNAYLYLNETFAADTANAALRFGNNSAVVQPTLSVFTIGNSVDVNQNTTTYVAYLFAEVAGFSKFGTWQNNNSTDGTFIYLGFRPRFILLKNYDNVEGWFIWDSARQTYNMAPPSNNWLNPNLSNAEGANNASTAEIDGLSNGFKIRTTNPATGEVSFGTRNYIYAAFAENPFKNSLAR